MAIDTQAVPKIRDYFDPIAARFKQDGIVTLWASPPTIDLLDQLSSRLRLPMNDVLIHALVLLDLAVGAQEREEQICFLDEDLNIVGEVGVIGRIEAGGDDELPDAELDPDDQ